jgi:hypothetical protein
MKEQVGINPSSNKIWDIVLIKKDDDSYIVMTPNGDVHCISENTFQTFVKADRVSYDKEKIKL